ncbi:deiodinase-like protein [Sediminitomix flava]|uniref:Peroxiredoxin n=1 Tax=Sediminitomix flava TaxID=379075 RepID=A0A315ZHS5_SEDFL|nr:deiodinase-like protein [Sediminitomix flava]PWJ44368.1 peroxiredoxin [Sediminitomix flava]
MKTNTNNSQNYNYPRFKADFYQFHDFMGLKEGDRFIDYELMTAEGKKVKISDFLDKPLVFEMGSITCPMYGGHVNPMQEIAKRHPEYNFVVLYVREAHPGNIIKNHLSQTDKVAAAREAIRFYDDRRTILIDNLDGKAHKTYGELPNSMFIIGTDGVIKYVRAWNNTDYLEPILEHISKNQSPDNLKFRPAKPGVIQSFKTLFHGGWVAAYDFIVELPLLLKKHYKAGNLF